MRLHPEGVEVLKYLVMLLVIPLVIALRFSDLIPRLYTALLERGMSRYPDRSRAKRKRKFYRPSEQEIRRQKIAFWCVLVILAALAILEWFVVPERFAIRKDVIAPLAVAMFSAGILVIYLGPARDERGANWSRWTFWATVVSTATAVMVIGYLLKADRPAWLVATLMLGFLVFVWISGFFRQVERAEAELEDIGVSKSYDGTTPIAAGTPYAEPTPRAAPSQAKPARTDKHRRRRNR